MVDAKRCGFGQNLFKGGSKRCVIITAAVLLAVAAGIVVLAVELHKKSRTPSYPLTVILPLYIYPTPGAWDPLYTA